MTLKKNRLKLGVIGLGQAGGMVIDEIRSVPDVPWDIVAGADPRPHAREKFEAQFGGKAYPDAEDLCRDSDVDAVYIASPSWMHLEHALAAAQYHKHVICEKPLTLSLDDAIQMVKAADKAGITLLAGHTHSFDAPIVKMTEMVQSGELGELRSINAWNFNEFNHRPRLISELVATRGPVLNQGPHHVDMIRQIGGGKVKSVRATTIPDGVTGVEGGYTCYLEFDNRVPATLVYDGRSLFDTAELFEWVGEGGNERDPESAPRNRRAFLDLMSKPESERDQVLESGKEAGRFGAVQARVLDNSHAAHRHLYQPFFGLVLVSCEDAALRQSKNGLYLYGKDGRKEVPIERTHGGRIAELNEMYESLALDRKPFHDGAWGLATLEVCFGILESAKTGREIPMQHQVAI
jgi:predicted dehydrogenase